MNTPARRAGRKKGMRWRMSEKADEKAGHATHGVRTKKAADEKAADEKAADEKAAHMGTLRRRKTIEKADDY